MRYWHFQINIAHIPSNPIIMGLLFIVPTESLIPQNLSGYSDLNIPTTLEKW